MLSDHRGRREFRQRDLNSCGDTVWEGDTEFDERNGEGHARSKRKLIGAARYATNGQPRDLADKNGR